ncbi:hypothetical protein GCM10020295_58550 [Streptomyces cinereospinus]
MGVSLSKGGNVSLTKEAPGLTAVIVGLGWDVRTTTGTDFDLDASALLLNNSGKVGSDQHFIFFNNLKSPDGSVEHTGDNLTGEGEGDDEQIKVNLAGVPAEIEKIVFPVSIYDAENRQQSFGQVRNAFIRVVNQAGGAEIARYDLSEDASTETAMVFGELYRHGAEWKFRAIGQGTPPGCAASRRTSASTSEPRSVSFRPSGAARLRAAPDAQDNHIRQHPGEDSIMGVTLAKGGNVSLSKAAPNLTQVMIGLGWDARSTTGAPFDLDASALVCSGGRVLGDEWFVFYNQLKSPDGSVEHTGDNLTGEGDGDDESILLDLSKVPAHCDKIVFPVSIHLADERGQTFGQVSNAFIRVVNQADGQELARYDLSEDASTETAMIFGEVYRYQGEWKFRAVGQGYASGLRGIALDFGVNVS